MLLYRLYTTGMLAASVLVMAHAVRAQGQATPDTGAQAGPPPAVQQQKPAQVSRPQSITLPPATSPLTGSLLLTGNLSTLGRPAPSLNERLNLDYALPHGQVFDLRVENYYDGSYNADPPGRLIRNINEQKLEIQGTYTVPLTKVFALSPALLHHDNFRFHDTYYWGILTLSARLPLSKTVTLTPNIAAEKRLSGGRLFADFAATLDYSFAPAWTFETNYHRYENWGELDSEPTEKEESEFAVIRQLPHNRTLGLSFFHHIQHDGANDQFSQVKLKYGIGF